MIENETRVRVRYAETDQMGVVYYANYFVWMELGRVELCRAAGLRYQELETRDGIYLTVAEASCRYVFPARYDEQVVVKTHISQANPRKVTFTYQMLSEESGRLLASGSTSHVFCGRDMRPMKLPAEHRPLFGIT